MPEGRPPTQVLAALADDSRWEILAEISREPSSASRLARELSISRQAIAKHLGVLAEVGLVSPVKVGREVRYEAVGATLSHVAQQLDSIGRGWDRRLAAIKNLAEQTGPRKTTP